MSTAFYKTLNPTPFGIFDDEADAKSVESQFSRSHITFITQPYLMDT